MNIMTAAPEFMVAKWDHIRECMRVSYHSAYRLEENIMPYQFERDEFRQWMLNGPALGAVLELRDVVVVRVK